MMTETLIIGWTILLSRPKNFTHAQSTEKYAWTRDKIWREEIYKGEAAVFASFNLIQSCSPGPTKTEQESVLAVCHKEREFSRPAAQPDWPKYSCATTTVLDFLC